MRNIGTCTLCAEKTSEEKSFAVMRFNLKPPTTKIASEKASIVTWLSIKAGIGNCSQASCRMRLLRRQLRCTLPSLFLLQPLFISFIVALSFKTSLHQKFRMRLNGCRESCSGVNWSISARLKLADGVTCNSACQVASFRA